jgi:hypothetical protein
LRSTIAAIEEYEGMVCDMLAPTEVFCSLSIEEDPCMSFGLV